MFHFFLFFFIVQGIVPLKKRNKREENKGKKKLDLLYVATKRYNEQFHVFVLHFHRKSRFSE